MRTFLPMLSAALMLTASCTSPPSGGESASRYLYVWAGDKDEKDSDFLAVVVVDR